MDVDRADCKRCRHLTIRNEHCACELKEKLEPCEEFSDASKPREVYNVEFYRR